MPSFMKNISRVSTSVLRTNIRQQYRYASSSGAGTAAAGTGASTNTTRTILGKIFFTSLCLGTGSLGFWQLQRYQWKVSVLEEAKKKLAEAPYDLSGITSKDQSDLSQSLTDMNGRRLLIKGKYDHNNEIKLGLRSAPAGLQSGGSAQGLATNPQGYYIITPLYRSNDNSVVFVNRGWSSKHEKNWNKPDGEVSIVAVLSSVDKKTTFAPVNDPSSKVLLWLEEDALIAAANLDKSTASPITLVEAIEDNDIKSNGYPVARKIKHIDEQYVSPITHLSYAFTWFALSTAGFGMTYKMFFRKAIRR